MGHDDLKAKNRRLLTRRVRAHEWTAKKRKTFLEHLAATSHVTESAAAAGMTKTGAYKLRYRDEEFRAQWAAALEQGYSRLEMMLQERASGPCEFELDGSLIVPAAETMDSELALNLLKQHAARRSGKVRDGRVPGKASMAEVREEITRLLSGLNKRLGGKG
jgi:hypothetical protein